MLLLTPEAAATVKQRFERLSSDLTAHSGGVPGLSAAISQGAGELASEVDGDATAFMQSWVAALDLLATSAALIAGNTNNVAVDLEALDRGSHVDLSRSGG